MMKEILPETRAYDGCQEFNVWVDQDTAGHVALNEIWDNSTKNAGVRLHDMANTGCDALGVDWTTTMVEARKLTDDQAALQGNLDPAVLYASQSVLKPK